MSEPAPQPAEAEWRRLSPRNLVIDPVRSLGRLALPILVAAFGIGGAGGLGRSLLAVPFLLLPLAFGALPWLTTRWRLADGELRWRRELVGRRSVTVRLDRVRSVDLEATLLHRLLGVSVVRIGTGVDDDRIILDSLRTEEAAELRAWLLARSAAAPPAAAEAADSPARPHVVEPAPVAVLATYDWSWLRYAPFSIARLVAVLAGVGIVSQLADDVGADANGIARGAADSLARLGLLVAMAVVVLAGLALWVLIAVVASALQWGGLQVTRESGTVHVRAGLLTTRSTTVEEARVRGVTLTESALVRLLGGAELAALSTGVGKGGTTKVLPPCPRPVAVDVAERLLASGAPVRDGVLDGVLVRHGPAARRRRYVRGLAGAVGVTAVATTLLVSTGGNLAWAVAVAVPALAFATVLAESAYRHLGHRLTDSHLVVGAGRLSARRTALERDGVIGWVVTQTWFQRRVGLATLVATTAAGSESLPLVDVPLPRALRLVEATTPDLLGPFLAAD